MKEEFKEWLAMIWQEDRGQCLGLASGIILALMILLIGFWRTAFIVLCGVKRTFFLFLPMTCSTASTACAASGRRKRPSRYMILGRLGKVRNES